MWSCGFPFLNLPVQLVVADDSIVPVFDRDTFFRWSGRRCEFQAPLNALRPRKSTFERCALALRGMHCSSDFVKSIGEDRWIATTGPPLRLAAQASIRMMWASSLPLLNIPTKLIERRCLEIAHDYIHFSPLLYPVRMGGLCVWRLGSLPARLHDLACCTDARPPHLESELLTEPRFRYAAQGTLSGCCLSARALANSTTSVPHRARAQGAAKRL